MAWHLPVPLAWPTMYVTPCEFGTRNRSLSAHPIFEGVTDNDDVVNVWKVYTDH